MEKTAILILLVLFISFSAIYLLSGPLSGMFVGFGPPTNATWWNVSWHYRIKIEMNSSVYDRTDWPIEYWINFTDNLPSGTFDINSTRLIEYTPAGEILYEVPSQFDPGENYDTSTNAVGELVFILNGTTQANSNRTFYLYYDITDNGYKEKPNYPYNINYGNGGEILSVNNSYFNIFIDTNRDENTSGMYRVKDIYENVIIVAASGDRTAEYLEYSNYSHNVSFDLIGNYSFVNGTSRVTVEQIGDEVLFGSVNEKTNEAVVNKKYYIYDKAGSQQYGSFIKIKQRVTNVAGYQISRNSTPSGALSFDLNRTLNSPGGIYDQGVDTQNPYSWVYGSGSGGDTVGILHLEQSGTSNYYALNNSFTSLGRVGIHLNETNISAGSFIEQKSLIYFSGTGGSDALLEFYSIINRFKNPMNISQSLPEVLYVIINTSTNSTIYNRNETVLLIGNVSGTDPYGFTEYMNATLDMGTGDTADDQTIILYDDGLHDDGNSDDDVYANTFQITNDANITTWTVNFTAYDNETNYLNTTTHIFSVTDILTVNVTVIDKKPMADTLVRANITVENYQQTAKIAGATINCSYNDTEVINKTEYGNGEYGINFTAPSTEGPYILICNATRNGNIGEGNDTFNVESSKTYVAINATPQNVTVSNITLYQNETFEITVNTSNTGNGTAYNSNITLELPQDWNSTPSFGSCGDIEKSDYCTKYFNITVPQNTSPANYTVNFTVEWGNPDGTNSTNQTSINVTVDSNPQINLTTNTLFGEGADGTSIHIDNFTVQSIGNDALQNVTFNCYQGIVCTAFDVNFTPNDIPSLQVNYNQSIAVNISVSLAYTPGNYIGYVNVSTENDNYEILELNITVPDITALNITLQPPAHTAYYVTQQNNETFTLNITLDNIENGSARYSNMSLTIPQNWMSTSYFEECNNLTADQNCTKTFNITIPNGTLAGSYLINVTSNWTNPDDSLGMSNISLNVTVANVPLIDVFEEYVSGTVGDGEEQHIGNFTVLSVGNGMIENITYICYQGTVCDNFTLNFTPVNISAIDVGQNESVAVNVTVPLGFFVGNYTGSINVSAQNDNYTIIGINITIPSNKTWTMSPTYCQKSEFPDEGTACEVVVYNLGNDNITINITPEEGTHTKVNITNFVVIAGSNYTFNVTYNVTNVTQAPYNSTFIVDALDSNANPDNMSLLVSLLPYQPPMINFTIIPNLTEQNGTVLILANITDMSTSKLKWVNATITTPDGQSTNNNMTLYNSSGDFYQYNLSYPDNFGNTTIRGNYSVMIYAEDNIGNAGNETKNFTVYTNLLITSETLADIYLQGDTGSIYYLVKNMSNIGLGSVNVSLLIYDSTNNVSYSSQYQTTSDGYIIPTPRFELASDSVTGNYTLISNSTYYDAGVDKIVKKQKNFTFEVKERTITVTGLFADIETSVIWYPNNEMRFAFLIYNGEGRPVDPDSMNLTIFDPSEDLYRNASMDSSWRRSAGYYVYDFIMPPTTVNGMYLAILNVSQGEFFTSQIKAFRVAQGGPYDVRIIPFEYEVRQRDYFDFALVIENKGTVSQDVFIEYNVTDENLTTRYYYASEAVYTPALSNQSFTRSAYVFSDQPLGIYILNVKVTFDYIQPPVPANTTFKVLEGIEAPEPPPPPTPPVTTLVPLIQRPPEEITASILITGYNSNVTLARGFSRVESVTVKNDGRTTLKNVSLFVLGIPTDWFIITPENYDSLKADESVVFLVEYFIPQNALPGQYKANLLTTSGLVSDQKTITVTVFESIKELLENEIKKLKEELIDLQVDTKIAERDGKDVSNVLTFINMTQSYITGAEDDIKNNRPEDAMDKISDAINLIKKAREVLEKLEVPEILPPIIPLWIIFVIFIVIIVLVFVIVFWKRKKLRPIIRPYIIPVSKLVESIKRKEVDKEALAKEKEKLSRMLKVLDKEKEEGIISSSAYTKMKKTIEEKIDKIEKKIK